MPVLIGCSSPQQKRQDNNLENIKEFNDNSKNYIIRDNNKKVDNDYFDWESARNFEEGCDEEYYKKRSYFIDKFGFDRGMDVEFDMSIEWQRLERFKKKCNVKGNISYTTGEKIYHLPECEFYNDTIIDENYGERWFCSEKEALDAGWRRAYTCP